jgi:microcin C transport system permease protein
MIPTLLGIILINFVLVQWAPGGPMERMMARLQGHAADGSSVLSGVSADMAAGASGSGAAKYRGAQGLEPELIARLEKMYGFDKPAYQRFFEMLWNYLKFDFGESFFQSRAVTSIIADKLPVSISLGIWSTLLVYWVSIPLGIAKAIRDGSRFDVSSSVILMVMHAIPSFVLAVLLVVLFAGGSFWDWFPLRGLVSDDWHTLSWGGKIIDYLWHMVLPITAIILGGFASLTLLTKNSFIDEINKQYVVTARAKGLTETRVLYGHVFRNAMLIVVAGFPAAMIGIFFTDALLIENIFSLDGLGLLSFQSIQTRDYPVIFSSLYIFTLIGLLTGLLSDVMKILVDPRINYDSVST